MEVIIKKLIGYVFLIIFSIIFYTTGNGESDQGKDDFCSFWNEKILPKCDSCGSKILKFASFLKFAGLFTDYADQKNNFCGLIRALDKDERLRDMLMSFKPELGEVASLNNDFKNYYNCNDNNNDNKKIRAAAFKFIPPHLAECLGVKESELTKELIDRVNRGDVNKEDPKVERFTRCMKLALITMKRVYEDHKKKT